MTPQTRNAEGYAEIARFVTDLGMPVVEPLAASDQPGKRLTQ
jgi:hypothetical protein